MTKQQEVLAYVATFPGEYTARDLAQEMGYSEGSMGRILAQLRRAGMVARPDATGRLWCTAFGVTRAAQWGAFDRVAS